MNTSQRKHPYGTNVSSQRPPPSVVSINFNSKQYTSIRVVLPLLDDLLERVYVIHRMRIALTKLPDYTIERTVLESRMASELYLTMPDHQLFLLDPINEFSEPIASHIDRYIEPLKVNERVNSDIRPPSENESMTMKRRGSRQSSRSVNRKRIHFPLINE